MCCSYFLLATSYLLLICEDCYSDYDCHSDPHNMTKTYTRREIASQLGCSPNTIDFDIEFLKLEPVIGDRGMKLYSDRNFNLIAQLRLHLKNKANTRDSFVPNTEIEIVEDEPKVSKLIKTKDRSSVNHEYSQGLQLGLAADPFFDLEMLQRICDRGWLLPSNRLAPLFQITPKHLNTKNRYYYCGFIATKEIYANNRVLWKIDANNS